MHRHIAHVSLLVKDYDEAINFYIEKLNFQLIEDTILSADKRWVLIASSASEQTCLLLAKAANEIQLAAVGNQSGGRVFLFLRTDDFWRDYHAMQKNQIKFIRSPKEEPYGIVAVFEDLYGNLWDLLQLTPNANPSSV